MNVYLKNSNLFRRLTIRLFMVSAMASLGGTASSTESVLPLSVTVAGDQITVTDAEPNGAILFIGSARGYENYTSVLRRHRALLPADAGGTRSLQPVGGVAEDSVWVAVELASGRYGTSATPGRPVRELAMGPSALQRPGGGQSPKLVSQLPYAYFVLVRPGTGAWESTAGDGGTQDHDGNVDGAIQLALADLVQIRDAGPAPADVLPGDLLIVFSPEQSAFFVTRVE